MNRRKFLVVAGSATLAGCGGKVESDSPNGTTTSATTTSRTTSSTTAQKTTSSGKQSEPTVRTTTTAEQVVEEKLSFGDWWSQRRYAYSVTGLEASTTFYDTFEKNKEMEMPDGQKLLFADLKAKNSSQETQYNPPADSFGAIHGSDSYEVTGGFDHPEYSSDYGVDMDWFERASQKPRMQGSVTREIEPGEVKNFWIGFVVSRDLDVSKTNIGYDTYTEGKYEIRWFQ